MADPGALRAALADLSLTTRSKYMIHFRIDLALGDANVTWLNREVRSVADADVSLNRGMDRDVALVL